MGATQTLDRPIADSYWPEDILAVHTPPEESPAELLHACAADLNARSEGLLHASVEESSWGEYLTFDFVLVSPALDNYVYRLFKLRHKLEPYPAEFIFDGRVMRARNRQELENRLRAILSDPTAKRAVAEMAHYSRERIARKSEPV